MPGALHRSYEIHISLADDIRASFTSELESYFKNNCIWYAMKHEIGESGKLHLHAVFVFEILTATTNGGAKTKYNVERTIQPHYPQFKQYLLDHPSKYAVVMAPLKSDDFVEYMQKEGEFTYSKLPKDMLEIRPYFADMQAKKPKNSEYDSWETLYKDENRDLPADYESVWNFFSEHMYIENDMRLVSDPKRFRERVSSFVHFVNKTVPPPPVSFKRPRLNEFGFDQRDWDKNYASRVCPRCEAQGRDAPNLLEPRQQFCAACKRY